MATTKTDLFGESLIDAVVARLDANQSVRRTLPDGGRLHIDRQLPFLVVHRRAMAPAGDLSRLVRGEASYLVASSERSYVRKVDHLVSAIAQRMLDVFGGFLVIEVYPIESNEVAGASEGIDPPRFSIAVPKAGAGAPSVRSLEAALSRISIAGASADVGYDIGRRSPPGLGRIGTRVKDPSEADKPGVTWIGIGVAPAHVDSDTGDEYPEVARSLHRQFSRAIQRTAFEFAHRQTTQRPLHYQALGRRAFVKAARRADRELATVAARFDLLLSVSPINTEREYRRFKRTGKEPRFEYRPLTIDPALLKRSLYAIPVERVEDPTLESLFREKQRELSLKLDLLADRGTERFLHTSVVLYGSTDAATLTTARGLLDKLPREQDDRPRRTVGAEQLAELARAELDIYRAMMPGMDAGVSVRDDISTMMVSSGSVMIGSSVRVASDRVRALIQHEVGTHVVTYWNGTVQPFALLATGLAGHDELQEGFAVLAEYLVGGLTPARLRTLAGRVVAAESVVDGGTFTDTFSLLADEHGFLPRSAFLIATRVHRGGGFVKDAAYLRGLRRVVDYIAAGGRIESLLVGKLSVSHTAVIEELQRRRVLEPAPLRPAYLDDPDAHYRLEALRSDSDLLSMVSAPPGR